MLTLGVSQILQVKVQVYSLISSDIISTPRRAYSPAAVSAHWTYRTHCHLCPTRYSFSPSQVKHLRVKCLAKGHNILCPKIERGETWYFSGNSAPSGIRNRTAGSDMAERHALTIPLKSKSALNLLKYGVLNEMLVCNRDIQCPFKPPG